MQIIMLRAATDLSINANATDSSSVVLVMILRLRRHVPSSAGSYSELRSTSTGLLVLFSSLYSDLPILPPPFFFALLPCCGEAPTVSYPCVV